MHSTNSCLLCQILAENMRSMADWRAVGHLSRSANLLTIANGRERRSRAICRAVAMLAGHWPAALPQWWQLNLAPSGLKADLVLPDGCQIL